VGVVLMTCSCTVPLVFILASVLFCSPFHFCPSSLLLLIIESLISLFFFFFKLLLLLTHRFEF